MSDDPPTGKGRASHDATPMMLPLKSLMSKQSGFRLRWISEAMRLCTLWFVTGDRRHLSAGMAHLAAIIRRINPLLP